jgi:L-iditol 2-dehydrogenase
MGEAIKAFNHKVFGCDLKQERVDLSKKYGFTESFISGDDFLNKMKEFAPEGFDVIFLTAGASPTIDLALKTARDGATIVVFSSVKDLSGFPNNEIYYREITVMGSYSPSPKDLADSMDLISTRKVNVSGLSVVYPLEELNEAISDTLSNKIMKAFIKI